MTHSDDDSGNDTVHEVRVNLFPNEASGLLAAENETLLEARGWDCALWTLLGEGEIQDCLAIVGHDRGTSTVEGWQMERLNAQPKEDGIETEDGEALARFGGWIYAFGSHFGSKDGPLEPKRGFVARFREADVERAEGAPPVDIEVFRESFVLHRIINDALKERGLATIALAEEGYDQFIEATRRLGREEEKAWKGLVCGDDVPLNVEGAAFRPDGTLLLGLRFPVAEDGRPILVELEGIQHVFESGDKRPEVREIWVVDAIGPGGEMAGVRDLHTEGDEVHLITGNVDGKGERSPLIEAYDRGSNVETTHFRFSLRPESQPRSVAASVVRPFPEFPRLEGIASTGGRFFYAVDDDERVPLLISRPRPE